MHQAMMHDKKQFYSRIVLGGMFDIPPSTLNKLLSGRKYMGGAELEKYSEEMKRKGWTYQRGMKRSWEAASFQKKRDCQHQHQC